MKAFTRGRERMKPYVERMVRERGDLESKIKKAKAALENEPYDMTAIGRTLFGRTGKGNV